LGGKDSDVLGDGLGKDSVYGGSGADNLIGQGGLDHFYGGSGADLVQSKDIPAVQDFVNCGPGTDTVSADTADIVNDNCERVN
jgi:Ca2+-binding RTX toxin-like protein